MTSKMQQTSAAHFPNKILDLEGNAISYEEYAARREAKNTTPPSFGQDLRATYEALGGKAYLQRLAINNPELFLKYLIRFGVNDAQV